MKERGLRKRRKGCQKKGFGSLLKRRKGVALYEFYEGTEPFLSGFIEFESKERGKILSRSEEGASGLHMERESVLQGS